jgi:XRE family transcriptional regulator, master regulator for biofilm formation
MICGGGVVMKDSLFSAGKRLKELRTEKKIGLREFAKLVSYAPSYVSLVEKGERRGSVEFFEKCAKELHVSIGDLLEEKIVVPDDLKKEGVEWIVFGKELEKEGISMDQIKKWVNSYRADKKQ